MQHDLPVSSSHKFGTGSCATTTAMYQPMVFSFAFRFRNNWFRLGSFSPILSLECVSNIFALGFSMGDLSFLSATPGGSFPAIVVSTTPNDS